MSTTARRADDRGTDLVPPLSASTEPSVLDTGSPVVTATPAAVATGVGAGVVAGYVAGQAADD